MSNSLFLRGETVPVRPSTAVLTEFMRNGWTQEDLDRALSDRPWDENNFALCPEPAFAESPLESYKGSVGYLFDWGHVIEIHGAPFEGVPCYSVTWEFCLDTILSKTHRVGGNLGELCDLSMDYLGDFNCRTWPVSLDDGDSMSCFSLSIQTTDNSDKAAQEIEAARRWIAEVFLEDILDGLLEVLDESCSGVESLQ